MQAFVYKGWEEQIFKLRPAASIASFASTPASSRSTPAFVLSVAHLSFVVRHLSRLIYPRVTQAGARTHLPPLSGGCADIQSNPEGCSRRTHSYHTASALKLVVISFATCVVWRKLIRDGFNYRGVLQSPCSTGCADLVKSTVIVGFRLKFHSAEITDLHYQPDRPRRSPFWLPV